MFSVVDLRPTWVTFRTKLKKSLLKISYIFSKKGFSCILGNRTFWPQDYILSYIFSKNAVLIFWETQLFNLNLGGLCRGLFCGGGRGVKLPLPV